MSALTGRRLLTAEEFFARYGSTSGVELVRGRVVLGGREIAEVGADALNFSQAACAGRAASILTEFIREHDLGRVACNCSFTPGNQGSGRLVPAVMFVSYTRVPKGPPPNNLTTAPELVVEITHPNQRTADVLNTIADFFRAGVRCVLVLDPATRTATVCNPSRSDEAFGSADVLTLSDVLPGFAVPVARFFEE